MTAKTSVNMGFSRTYENYPASPATANLGLAERKDTTDYASLGLNWLAMRNLTIGASVVYSKRSSNYPFIPYDDTIGRLSATLTF